LVSRAGSTGHGWYAMPRGAALWPNGLSAEAAFARSDLKRFAATARLNLAPPLVFCDRPMESTSLRAFAMNPELLRRATKSQSFRLECQMFHKSVEKSDLLSYLLTKAVAAWTYMLGFLDCHFRIIYDPREPDEDAPVKEKIDSMASAMVQLSPEVEGLFLGLDIDRKSEDELGLQLADLMAGKTREFGHLDNGRDNTLNGVRPKNSLN
jgi:hypothetical protein